MEISIFRTSHYTACVMPKDSKLQVLPLSHSDETPCVLRRLEQIEALSVAQQAALLRTVDTFLEGAAARAARRA